MKYQLRYQLLRRSSLWMLVAVVGFSCGVKRDNTAIILYSQEYSATKMTSTIDLLRKVGLTIDTASLEGSRPGNRLWSYQLVMVLSDPDNLNARWQSDIERYVQSGGGLLVLDEPVNTYQWPWLVNAAYSENQSYDGGKVTFFADSLVDVELVKRSLSSSEIKENQVSSVSAPDFSRFTKTTLDADVNEPMELAILPSGKVLFIEREGNFKMFDPALNKTRLLHTFNVSTEGNYEDGMLGLAIDPHYEQNSWIYIYYSPNGGRARQNLSRFVLAGEDGLILSSEKVVLEVTVQRETCCHSGGSVVFGPEGNLFLSTGDNTSSKESDGYSPLDERPGRSPFDAQKGTSNTNDLRGKILKITPTNDGSYIIPDGNLFPKDGSKGRPEIYAMGCRNPFRFTVDQKTGILYWGDVGPDSGKDSELGPQSYDEWNQAKTPGYYGWPYFGADNKAYPMLDFETMELGPKQDPEHPINESPNNTGARELPPARIPMIWYPYGESEIWPMLGKGSRSAMSGPVYYKPATTSTTGFPEYYNGKLFIYEWARSWIKVVSFDEDWNMTKIEDFLPDETFVKPIDMEFDQYGTMYLLEYGANYFANNVDARLVKIEYSEGNRLPVPSINTDRTRGAVPLTINFSAADSYDFDPKDSLQFEWVSSDGVKYQGIETAIKFETQGSHQVRLIVKDSKGGEAESAVSIIAGNEPPEIIFELGGNQSFYFGNDALTYDVVVNDLEDGSTSDGIILADAVSINFGYLNSAHDLALLGKDFFRNPTINVKGKNFIDMSDCASCHSINQLSIGPSYKQIAERYKADQSAPEILATKIIEGGGGNWGHGMMAAHPQLTIEETEEMVDYILSLANEGSVSSLTLKGKLTFDQHEEKNKGVYVLGIRYTDRGNGEIASIESSRMIMIRPPELEAEAYDMYNDVQQQRPNGGDFAYLSNINNGSYIGYKNIDLMGIRKVSFRLMSFNGGMVKATLGSPKGRVIGQLQIAESKERKWMDYELSIDATDMIDDFYLIFENTERDQYLMNFDKILFKQ